MVGISQIKNDRLVDFILSCMHCTCLHIMLLLGIFNLHGYHFSHN